MANRILTPQSKEIVSRLYSSNEYNKREAIYRILFDRRTDLLPELRKAVKYEKNESIAVFMVQVAITLSTFPRDSAMERRILEILQYEEGGGVNDFAPTMWKYLENCATSQMIIAILGAMGTSIPANGYDFIEMCLTHPDPEVRAMVCEKAIKSGRPTHFAYVLNLVADKDPIVSETAFAVIKNLPEAELAIILDYALGSPDEWVLKTVAPFLPNLITNELRGVVAKVQYHSNHLVATKAREALKNLDAIPYITKRSMKDHDEAQKRKEEEEKEKDKNKEKEMVVLENGQKVSLKEQMEMKRKQKEEEDRLRKESNDALDKDIEAMSDTEKVDFEKEMAQYDSVLPIEEIKKPEPEEEDILPSAKEMEETRDFSEQADTLAEIDDYKAELAMEDMQKQETANKASAEQAIENNDQPTEATPDEAVSIDLMSETIPQEAPIASTEKIPEPEMPVPAQETNAIQQKQEEQNISLEVASDNTIKEPEPSPKPEIDLSNIDLSAAADMLDLSNADINLNQNNSEEKPNSQEQASKDDLGLGDDLINTLSDDINLNVTDEQKPVEAPKPTVKEENTTAKNTVPETQQTAAPKPQAVSSPTQQVSVPATAKEIFAKYPSFITDPLLEVFKQSTEKGKLKTIEVVLDNLTAFLNICFLQSAMYYAQESEMLTRSIKDCIKGNLTGPSAIRCLHNFVLAMKSVRGEPVFFTFPLSKIMSDSSDSSPLMLMRELKDFLREPEEPLNESLPQAIDGLLEILRGVRSITNNTLVMRAPQGAKQPYADLSGPAATVLVPEKRPSIDLPVGEIVLISKNGDEAFGLFPFFKYSKKKVIFTTPTREELSTFYERLEITP